MYGSEPKVQTAQPQASLKPWGTAGLIFMLLGVTLASPPSEAWKYNYQDVSQIGVKVKQAGDAEEMLETMEHPAPRILGEIIVLGKPVPGVLIRTDQDGLSCVTDEQGQFALEVPYDWSGRITPIKTGWVFDPPHREFHRIRRDIDERLNHDIYLAEEVPEAPPVRDEVSDCTAAPLPSAAPAWGRLGVTPMVLSFDAQPGETLKTSLAIQNMGIQSPSVTIVLADLQQTHSGTWKPVEPGMAAHQATVNSCRPWLALNHDSQETVSLSSMATMTCPLEIRVPASARGFYSAAVLVQPKDTADQESAFKCTLVVPVLVHVETAKIMADVKIAAIDFLVPFRSHEVAPPRVRLTLENQGATLSRVRASVTARATSNVNPSDPGQAMAFDDKWIMPGATLVLDTDYVGPHPTQALSLHGHLEIIEARAFTRHLPWTVEKVNGTDGQASDKGPAKFTHNPARTLAMLDYNEVKTLHLQQCHDTDDPFHTYSAQCHMGMAANFPATIQTLVQGCSLARGNWTATVQPSSIQQPSHVLLTVNGTDVAVGKLMQAKNVLVAKLAVQLIPEIGPWHPDACSPD